MAPVAVPRCRAGTRLTFRRCVKGPPFGGRGALCEVPDLQLEPPRRWEKEALENLKSQEFKIPGKFQGISQEVHII